MVKRSFTPLAVLIALALLAGCSPAAEDGAPEAEETVAATPEPAGTVAVSDEAGIPAAMLGVWDYVEGTCDPASDLRLEIAPGQLTFYESVGEVQSVTRNGGDVTITLAMSGEGETWDESLTYRLVEDGAIIESDLPAPAGEGKLRRKRCEG